MQDPGSRQVSLASFDDISVAGLLASSFPYSDIHNL